MLQRTMILDSFPTADEFYKTYWGKKPFIVRGYIPANVIENLVDGDTMAGLSLEENIKSRLITNSDAGQDWVCEHGPFEEERFESLGEKNWSLLVQNVEQYHTDTAQLLSYFQMSPRWLMDDVMVSYSAVGGSVGPHTDSYHTFLVQGIGKRSWKISSGVVDDKRYADNPDVKVLKHGFSGEVFEVEAGDVIYMPPFFGHEGRTLETAMTFSVGFLGPKMSEILSEYAHYLEESEDLNIRYLGQDLSSDSAGFEMSSSAQQELRHNAVSAIQSDDFSRWMSLYFSTPSHEDIDGMYGDKDALRGDEKIYKPEHVKIAITPSENSSPHIAVYGEILPVLPLHVKLIKQLNNGQLIDLNDLGNENNYEDIIALISYLYGRNALWVKD